MKGGNSMNYITAISPDFYNPTYFNILESMEYELLAYEHQCMMEAFNEVLIEADEVAGTTYKKPDGILKKIKNGIKSKVTNDDGSKPLTKGQAFMQRMKAWFKLIKDKLKVILRKFMDKVDELFKLNDKFIKERLYWVTGIDRDFWKGATVTIYNYNRVDLDKTIYTIFQCPEIDANNSTLKQWMAEDGSKEDFINKHFKKVMDCAGPKDGFKEAAKNYFRGTKNGEAKMHQLTEGDAQKRAEWCFNYLQSYKDKTARNIRDAITKLHGAIDRVEKDFTTDKMIKYMDNQSSTTEHWVPIYEADIQVNVRNSSVTNGSANVQNANGIGAVKQGGENHTGTELFNKVHNYGDILMVLHTAQMTIAEEYYFASIHVLKSLYKLADDQGFLNKMKAEQEKKKLVKQGESKAEANENGKNGENIIKTQQKMGPD